ncbi:MAG: (E)-4-hydroxy-3-methylbut-2-enyl-diphosphate synthase [Cyclobacteriaceae bacterium]|nr:(E)-4-hydroxy-3-methylbut-2-enyl-diphosphate synthase [Cyclobacteriaceae bacterium]
MSKKYCNTLTEYSRRKTREVKVGKVPLGGDHPIRVQSMTTIDTMDTLGSVEQTIRMVQSGCEYVRITAPSLKEAQNLENIKKELLERGVDVPLIADIHFTPNAAELAARLIEKVRVNPGNYVDKKKFEQIEYADDDYLQELDRIRKRFTPLVEICKEFDTAIRIGTNHGSLSDRIMSRYGDTPIGMVESALEFIRICEELNFHNIVVSMKSSNPQVMVQAYRLLVNKLEEEGLEPYPLHLGVTEAGEGEDGRIKSALGIGTLLEDGLGDTVRVSLTEEPEFEAPVAQMLIDRYANRKHTFINDILDSPIDPFAYHKRVTHIVENIGEHHVPRVIADVSKIENIEFKDLKSIGHFHLSAMDKWKMNDQGADFVYSGINPIPFMLPNGLKEIIDHSVWKQKADATNYPLIPWKEYTTSIPKHPTLNFLSLNSNDWCDQLKNVLKNDTSIVIVLSSKNQHALADLRRFFFFCIESHITNPIIINRAYENTSEESFQLQSSTDVGGLLIDGLGDGVFFPIQKLKKEEIIHQLKSKNKTAFGILQAARTRMSKTEYISCPSCGRTLFDLQETTAKIRNRTDHLKGVKIGIMGCIVNGPGEMADADYGYVGSGKGKITLYKGQEVVKRGVASDKAVDELIDIIKDGGDWIDAQEVEI